jgi:hypothetical protein
MSFVYPDEVSDLLKERWHSFRGELYKNRPHCRIIPPFPTDNNLRLLLDTVYHASFLSEEARQLFIRLLYMPPEASLSEPYRLQNNDVQPYHFSAPCPLTVQEVLRLVPALDPFQSLLVVCADEDLPEPTGMAPLVIWGVLKLGLEWWRVVTGRSSHAFAPPYRLTVTSQGPGRITATALGRVLVRLVDGRILGMPLETMSKGPIGNFLKPSADQVCFDVVKKLTVPKYDRKADSDEYPRGEYFRVFGNIVNLAKEKRHGATFIVFRDPINHLDRRLSETINLKYVIDGVCIWDQLVEESVARHHRNHLNEHLAQTDVAHAKPEQLAELMRWQTQCRGAAEQIWEFENFVASLSGIDGCVVMTAGLKVLGFGGEILVRPPNLTRVKVARDPDAQETSDQKITASGTRHRSAFRICASFEDCVAFVVSQDGGVKAIKRVGQDVVLWPDVNMGWIDL